MRASELSSFAQSDALPPAGAVGCLEPSMSSGRRLGLPRTALLSFATLAALAICLLDAIAVRANTPQAAATDYACYCVAMLGCAAAFWSYARSAEGALRMRWWLMVAALLAMSVGYAQSFADTSGITTTFLKPYQAVFFTIGNALYLLAAVLTFAGVSRSIAVLDTLQALLFTVLRFNLTYSTTTRDHFAVDHYLIGQLVAFFFFLIAMIASVGAASPSELKFLGLISWFFGLRFVGLFFSDQVSYTWMHNDSCSLWDVPATALLAGFALSVLYLHRPARAQVRRRAPARRPSLTVRNLMPSFLALANLMLGLFVLRVSVFLAVISISLAVVLYVARTVMLQGHTAQETAVLQRRNEQLEGLATRDALTGIGNRRSLAGVYAQLHASAGSSKVAVLLMDIDHFKQANDIRGHLYGDRVLMALADTLEVAAASVAGGHCARFGGDEFALLIPDASSESARLLAEEVRAGFAAHGFQAGERSVSISLGVHTLDAVDNLPLETLIARADAALYRAKLLGRDRVEIYASRELNAGPDISTPGTPFALLRAN